MGKELGKLAPYLRKKGCLQAVLILWDGDGAEAAVKRRCRLFTKNTGLRETVKVMYGA